MAELQSIPAGSLVIIRDLRFGPDSDALGDLRAAIELDGQMHVRSEEIDFARETTR